MDGFIGISEKRLSHILGVARKCYNIARDEGFDEDFCRRMWLVGWLHDVGYEFSVVRKGHSVVSGDTARLIASDLSDPDLHKVITAISFHGKYLPETEEVSDEWRILNMADLTTDSSGNDIDICSRLEHIKKGYGEESEEYIRVCNIARQIGMTE